MMRRIARAALLAGSAMFLTAAAAFASSHTGSPEGLGFIGVVLFEIEHFSLHLQLTFSAIMTAFSTPALGFAMLADQTLCASVTPLVGLLFGSAASAIVTLLATVLLLAFVVTTLVRQMLIATAGRARLAVFA